MTNTKQQINNELQELTKDELSQISAGKKCPILNIHAPTYGEPLCDNILKPHTTKAWFNKAD